MNKKKIVWLGTILVILALFFSLTLFAANTFVCIFVAMLGVITLFFALFESRYVVCEKIVLIAILSAIAAIGRIFFASIASVQPSSFIIIMTGIIFGKEVGFITGATTALASNLILGQGPWTVWQMFSWGIMGFLSGAFQNSLKNNRILLTIYGFVWGFIFGWIMNSWFLCSGYVKEINLAAIITAYVASFPMDLAHGVCNVVFIVLFSKSFIKILDRIALKYGLK